MFGLGPGKLLLLVAAIAAVWLVYRWLDRVRRNKQLEARRRRDGEAIELVRNPRTGAYEPRRDDS